MARSPHGLLNQIEGGALDSKASLADVLRKCVALGGRAGSAELRDWARRELDGYPGEELLPDYRVVHAPIAIDGVNLRWQVSGQQISTLQLPDFARAVITEQAPLRFGVAELERMADRSDALKFQHPGMPDLVHLMNGTSDYGTAIHAMYWKVEPVTIGGVLDTIRTTLVSLVAEMRAAGVHGDEIPPTEVAGQAIQVVINGAERSPITVTTAVATSGGTASAEQNIQSRELASRIPGWIRGPWIFVVGAAGIIGSGAGVAAWQGWNPF